jgi:hypothetical protein
VICTETSLNTLLLFIRFDAKWNVEEGPEKRTVSVHVKSYEMLNLNFTSSLIDLYAIVSANWRDDYYQAAGLTPQELALVRSNSYSAEERFVPSPFLSLSRNF